MERGPFGKRRRWRFARCLGSWLRWCSFYRFRRRPRHNRRWSWFSGGGSGRRLRYPWRLDGLRIDRFRRLRLHDSRFPRWRCDLYHFRWFRRRGRGFVDLGSSQLRAFGERRSWRLLQLGEWRGLNDRLNRRPSLSGRVTSALCAESGRPFFSANFTIVGWGTDVGGTWWPFPLLFCFLLDRVAGGMRGNTRSARSG